MALRKLKGQEVEDAREGLDLLRRMVLGDQALGAADFWDDGRLYRLQLACDCLIASEKLPKGLELLKVYAVMIKGYQALKMTFGDALNLPDKPKKRAKKKPTIEV